MAKQPKRSVPSQIKQTQTPTPAPSRLNVIFHGPFIFVFYDNRVEVMGADIEEHIVGAGTWTREIPCAPGIYHLTGIDPKSQDPLQPLPVEAATHAVIDAKKYTSIKVAQESYYKFVLDKPSSMSALGLMIPRSQPVFIGDDLDKVTVPDKFGSAHVLSYNIHGSDLLQLEGLQWLPSANVSNVINLHIFAESPFMLDLFHPNRDFSTMVAMLPGLKLGLSRPFPDIDFVPNTSAAAPLGISNSEEGGLRGLPPLANDLGNSQQDLEPPRICDAPSLVVINVADTVP